MKGIKLITRMTVLLASVLAVTSIASVSIDQLQEDQKLNGFEVKNIYENGLGQIMGARFISEKYGFIVDLVQVQSVPQAFYWIKTPPTSSMGEPHACEHLLLGKGNRARYVSSLEDMSLSNSSAFTSQLRTCYHFNTIAGIETFYTIFEEKLMAFLHPDFTDEEIRREVCHIGVIENDDGTLAIDEKGSVYTEMVSSCEKPWYHYGRHMNLMVFGEGHPLSNISGGDPSVMRDMVPEDMWKFHRDTHHLANMGVIISISEDIEIASFLKYIDAILNRCQETQGSNPTVSIGEFDLPPLSMAEPGSLLLATYPSEKSTDPGYTTFAWPAAIELDYKEKFMLELFLEAFAGGETSNLYDVFINSQTRQVNFGGNYVYSGLDDDQGNSVYLVYIGLDNSSIAETMLDSIRTIILNELQRVHDFSDGSEELADFNKRIKSILVKNKKQIDHYLNSPPMFGFRSGAGAGWLSLLEDLEDEPGFRKSLVQKNRFDYANNLLASGKNIWRDYIDSWKLLDIVPYAVGSKPDIEMITRETAAKEARLAGYIEEFKAKYNVGTDQEAISKYKEDFDKKTAELEAIADRGELPRFIDNPPMTLDDQLNYEMINLPDDIPLVASTFENMVSSEIGIGLRLDVIPESLLVYVPFLSSVLTEIGVVKDGEVVMYEDMVERLRNEVLDLYAYFSRSGITDRVELVLVGRGNNLQELRNVIGWLDAALYSPYLSAENIPRLIDLIDQGLINYRNRMKGSEESWVDYVSNGYRHQKNPLYLSAGCFLTETHHYQRLKWQLTDTGNKDEKREINSFLDALLEYGVGKTREELISALSAIEGGQQLPQDLKIDIASYPEKSKGIAVEIAKALNTTLADIPDENLAGDWQYLCREIKADIMIEPGDAIAAIKNVLNMIRKADNARLFMISNSNDRKATLDDIRKLTGKLDSESESIRQEYAANNRIIDKLKSRHAELNTPLYVGLVHEGTRNGVLIFTAENAGIYDNAETSILDCLTGKLYSGGGPHSLFMKTWAAGLAYSNGYRYNEVNGRLRYYAERCPDVSETMKFVIDQLKAATPEPYLTDYAIAQVFGRSRAQGRYEARGESIASDLTDNITPQTIKDFRQAVLDLRDREDLFDKLVSRMEKVYGPVLIGYGAPLKESRNGIFFLIGPGSQFQSLERYIASVEEPQTVYRLYPRDFWLTR